MAGRVPDSGGYREGPDLSADGPATGTGAGTRQLHGAPGTAFFSRLLAGIYSLVLATMATAVTMIAWALRRGRQTPPAQLDREGQLAGHLQPGPLPPIDHAIEPRPVAVGDVPQERHSRPVSLFNEHHDLRNRRADQSQTVRLSANPPRPPRRSNDGQAILRAILLELGTCSDLVFRVELWGFEPQTSCMPCTLQPSLGVA